MRKGIVAAIVVLSLLVCAILSLLVANIFFGFRSFTASESVGVIGGADGPTAIFTTDRSGRDLIYDETFSAGGVTDVFMHLGSDAVDILESPDDSFRVVQYGRNLEEDLYVTAEVSGGALTVRRNEENFFNFSFGVNVNQSWVELYVPAGYNGNMDLALSSGDMRLQKDLSLKDLALEVSSGSFRTENDIMAEDAVLELSSGGLSLGSLSAGTFTARVSSGEMRAGSLAGSGELEVLSGSMAVDSVEIGEYLSAKISSGSMNLTLANDPSLRFTGTESSGSLHTYFEKFYNNDRKHDSFATVGEAPFKQLTAEVLSGELRISGETGKASVPGEGAAGDFIAARSADEAEDLREQEEDRQDELDELQEELLQRQEELREQQRELEEQARELEEELRAQASELEEELMGNYTA